ncbi:MAG: glycosyltransferase family 2 protein, partial [Chloroflexi bacterium]
YVMIFDADFVPPADAIWHFLDYFGRLAKAKYASPSEHATAGAPQNGDRVAAVQGYQWHMLNASENWITKGVRAEFSGSYVLERSGQELFGAMKMISGSVYMIRADVLRKLGWSTSITEDWELTIRLYLAGYKVLYTPYIQAPAECVSTVRRLIKQRMRWAEGHTYNVRKYFWPVLRSPNLSWQEKLEFIYYAPYYLQSVLFAVATGSWIIGPALAQPFLAGKARVHLLRPLLPAVGAVRGGHGLLDHRRFDPGSEAADVGRGLRLVAGGLKRPGAAAHEPLWGAAGGLAAPRRARPAFVHRPFLDPRPLPGLRLDEGDEREEGRRLGAHPQVRRGHREVGALPPRAPHALGDAQAQAHGQEKLARRAPRRGGGGGFRRRRHPHHRRALAARGRGERRCQRDGLRNAGAARHRAPACGPRARLAAAAPPDDRDRAGIHPRPGDERGLPRARRPGRRGDGQLERVHAGTHQRARRAEPRYGAELHLLGTGDHLQGDGQRHRHQREHHPDQRKRWIQRRHGGVGRLARRRHHIVVTDDERAVAVRP